MLIDPVKKGCLKSDLEYREKMKEVINNTRKGKQKDFSGATENFKKLLENEIEKDREKTKPGKILWKGKPL